jgi:chemotaxis signal transduction protein
VLATGATAGCGEMRRSHCAAGHYAAPAASSLDWLQFPLGREASDAVGFEVQQIAEMAGLFRVFGSPRFMVGVKFCRHKSRA